MRTIGVVRPMAVRQRTTIVVPAERLSRVILNLSAAVVEQNQRFLLNLKSRIDRGEVSEDL